MSSSSGAGMNRREFLRTAGLVGGAAMLGGPTLLRTLDVSSPANAAPLAPPYIPPHSVLNAPAAECPVDTVVVLMMENRSFDHYFGHLATDDQYLEEGRSRHGRDFSLNGRTDVIYKDEFGNSVETTRVRDLHNEPNPLRGCLHNDPGHGWGPARVQRDKGFLAAGTGNDAFAASYYHGEEIPVQS